MEDIVELIASRCRGVDSRLRNGRMLSLLKPRPPSDGIAFEHLKQSNGRPLTEKLLAFKVEGKVPGLGCCHILLRLSLFSASIPRRTLLQTEKIKQDCTSERVPAETNGALERWVPFLEKPVDAITLVAHDTHNMLPILALVEKHVHGQIGDEVPDRRHPFQCDISKAGVFVF